MRQCINKLSARIDRKSSASMALLLEYSYRNQLSTSGVKKMKKKSKVKKVLFALFLGIMIFELGSVLLITIKAL